MQKQQISPSQTPQSATIQSIKQKLNKISQQIPNHAKLINNTFYMVCNQQMEACIRKLFDLTINGFFKFVENVVGASVKKTDQTQVQGKVIQLYAIQFNDTVQHPQSKSADQQVLQKLMSLNWNQGHKPKSECHLPNANSMSNINAYDVVSLQLNLPPNTQSQMHFLQQQQQLKDTLLRTFKQSTKQNTAFIYQIIYKILISTKDKKVSPCQLMQYLTELRDRIFESQRDVQDCIDKFKQKIRSYQQQQNNNNISTGNLYGVVRQSKSNNNQDNSDAMKMSQEYRQDKQN